MIRLASVLLAAKWEGDGVILPAFKLNENYMENIVELFFFMCRGVFYNSCTHLEK